MDNTESDLQICSDEDILKLLSHFVKTNHRVKNADIKGETIMELCCLLFSKDYKFTIIPNFNGELCSHYPMKLMITEFEKVGHNQDSDEHFESRHSQHTIFQMMKIARCARCRSRFVVPVIFFEGKHICRSATLSGAAEMFGRSTTDYFMSNQSSTTSQSNADIGRPDMFDRFRGYDIQLLKYFDVGYICDLMVEKKKTKFGLPLTSSEKVDKENRYSDFTILGMPYPGCEFFKEWKDNFYCGESTIYDWGAALNDSSLELPSTPFVNDLQIDWDGYKEWSLTKLTQNYMKLLLKHIKDASTGLLIHCISGWDRTPLFVSLLRLSLWADGLIHTSLKPTEILYLTLGYDWYLFGHDLPDRLSNDEEVMFFCFKVLKEIASESFSLITRPDHIAGTVNSKECSPPVQPQSNSSSLPIQQQQHQRQKHQQNQFRVDSDSNLGIQGVLLADDLMSFPRKGSTSSLNSLESIEGPVEPCHFTVGDIQEKEEMDNVKGERGDGGVETMKSERTSVPINVIANNTSSSSTSGRRGNRRRSSTDASGVQQALSIQSNHFMNSPLGRASSPMCVPGRGTPLDHGGINQLPSTSSMSVGSWQIIPSVDNLGGMDSNNFNRNSITDKSSHASSCHDTCELNSARWKRLDAVSRIFESAYIRAVPSAHVRTPSVGAGLTSLFDRFAEQVGLRGGGPNKNSSSRRGV